MMPSKPTEPGAVRSDGDADAAHLRSAALAGARLARRPSLNTSAPRSSASFTNALVTCGRWPFGSGGP